MRYFTSARPRVGRMVYISSAGRSRCTTILTTLGHSLVFVHWKTCAAKIASTLSQTNTGRKIASVFPSNFDAVFDAGLPTRKRRLAPMLNLIRNRLQLGFYCAACVSKSKSGLNQMRSSSLFFSHPCRLQFGSESRLQIPGDLLFRSNFSGEIRGGDILGDPLCVSVSTTDGAGIIIIKILSYGCIYMH